MLSAAGAPTPYVEAPAPFDHLVDAARCLVLHSAPGLKILQPGRSIQAVHRAAHARQAVSVSELPMAPGAQGGIHVSRIFGGGPNPRPASLQKEPRSGVWQVASRDARAAMN